MQKDYDVELDWKPFQLHPDIPPGGMPMSDYFGPRTEAMRAHLRRFAASFGIENLEPAPRLANTLRVLSTAEWARDQGRLAEFRAAAMNAYWREHRGVESDDEIARIARSAGLDPEAAVAAAEDPTYRGRVEKTSEEGRRRGVTGIPYFFIGQIRVVGCQPYEVLARAAEHAGARRR